MLIFEVKNPRRIRNMKGRASQRLLANQQDPAALIRAVFFFVGRHYAGELKHIMAKVKLTLDQATRFQRGSRVIALLFFNLGARCGWSEPRPGRFTPGKDTVPIV